MCRNRCHSVRIALLLTLGFSVVRPTDGNPVVPIERVRGLCAAMGDPEPAVRRTAIERLRTYHHRWTANLSEKGTEAVVTELLSMTGDSDAEVRMEVAAALGELDPMGRHVDQVASLVHDPSSAVREAAIGAMRSSGPSSRLHLPLLFNVLRSSHETSDARCAAALAIAQIGGSPSLAKLTPLLSDENREVRSTIAGIVGDLAEPSAANALRLAELVKNDSSHRAAVALSKMGVHASPFVADIVPLITQNELMRDEPVAALIRLGPHMASAGPAVVELLDNRSVGIRRDGLRILAAMGPSAVNYRQQIVARTTDSDASVCEQAWNAWCASECHQPGFVEWVKKSSPKENWPARLAMLTPLIDIGEHELAMELMFDWATRSDFPYDKTERLDAAARHLFSVDVNEAAIAEGILGRLNDFSFGPYACSAAVSGLSEYARGDVDAVPLWLTDERAAVRAAAINVIATLSEDGVAVQQASWVPGIQQILHSNNPTLQQLAIDAVGRIGNTTPFMPRIVDLLGSHAREVRFAALTAIESNPVEAKRYEGRVNELLRNGSFSVSVGAAGAMAMILGDAAQDQVPLLGRMMPEASSDERVVLLSAIASIGGADRKTAEQIVWMLGDESFNVRRAATTALSSIGEHVRDFEPEIRRLITRPDDGDYTSERAWALRMRSLAKLGRQTPAVATWLLDVIDDEHRLTTQELRESGFYNEFAVEEIDGLARLISTTHQDDLQRLEMIVDVYGCAAPLLESLPTSSTNRLIQWLVRREERPDVVQQSMITRQPVPGYFSDLLASFRTVWTASQSKHDRAVRSQVIDRLEGLLNDVQWQPSDAEELSKWHPMLQIQYRSTADRIKSAAIGTGIRWDETATRSATPDNELADSVRRDAGADDSPHLSGPAATSATKDPQVATRAAGSDGGQGVDAPSPLGRILKRLDWFDSALVWIGVSFLLHVTFWVALIAIYPRSRRVQSLLFWNPWFRRIGGLGYVGFLLGNVPQLRRIVFAPFRETLLADAAMREFESNVFFSDLDIVDALSGRKSPLGEAIPEIRGQVLLQGDSGLGKSMILRWLASRSSRVTVFLPASKCCHGVLPAIKAKLEGIAGDESFLQSMIYRGALDICIDGLNEVDPHTLARISQFVERFRHGNILLASQVMHWTPPANVRPLHLQPLSETRVLDFLRSRSTTLPVDAPVQGHAFIESCDRFWKGRYDGVPGLQARKSVDHVLSVPMDLVTASELIAGGTTPDLYRMRDQQFNVVVAEYQRNNRGCDFPLNRFCDTVYRMRLADEREFSGTRFRNELECMEQSKMVVIRRDGSGDTDERRWYFRHDKTMEYFIAHHLINQPSLRPRHLHDARFCGVYAQLAERLELPDAEVLKEQLAQHAVKAKDIATLTVFVEQLNRRQSRSGTPGLGSNQHAA